MDHIRSDRSVIVDSGGAIRRDDRQSAARARGRAYAPAASGLSLRAPHMEHPCGVRGCVEALERDAGEAAADARASAALRRAALEPGGSAAAGSSELLQGFARSDFSAVDFINQRFPTEHSLSAAEDVSTMLRGVTLQLERDMMRAVREQATSKDRGQQQLAAAKSAIHGLFDRIGQIQTKARQTEATVEGICGGIRQLDAAKQNLTSTVTALRRLQMLVQAVDQLERSAGSRQYGTAPGLLDATNQLADHFERYRDVPKIAELQRKIDATVKVRRPALPAPQRAVPTPPALASPECLAALLRSLPPPPPAHDTCSPVAAASRPGDTGAASAGAVRHQARGGRSRSFLRR